MNSSSQSEWGYLRSDVIAEPLINQWYAWTYLLPPACYARYLCKSHLRILKSFINAPEVHQKALENPALLGGPFIAQALNQVDEVKELLNRTEEELGDLIELSDAIDQLNELLANHPAGESLVELYELIPDPLKGYVELVYDTNHNPNIRFLESFLYQSEYYHSQHQSIALRILENADDRAFVLSTPRLSVDMALHLEREFSDPILDELFKARYQKTNIEKLAQDLNLKDEDKHIFSSLFTQDSPPSPNSYGGDNLRIKYFGHACVLLETKSTSILVDALLAYPNQADNKRYSLLDLPEHIDYLVLTHNHQDHVMIETLIQIRHRIGEVVIPAGQQGSLIDPSLYLCLKALGFNQIRELNHLDAIEFPEGKIICTPFLGEHGDLDIQCKAAWRIEACGRSVMCVADSDNVDNTLYEHINHLFPDLDILFLGMECDGAPYTWIYGPVLSAKVSRQQSEARRLNGSDAQRGMKLIEQLNPQTVFVYAMGLEPWLKFITSIDYVDDDLAILESNKLIEQCQAQGRTAERILGCAEFELTSKKHIKDSHRRLPARRINTKNPIAENVISVENKSKIPETSIQSTFASNEKADPLSDLLDELHSAKIRIAVVDGQLKINAPKGTLTKDLTARIKIHKNDILALLNSHANTSDESNSDSLPEDAILKEAFTPLSNQNMISNSKDATDILLTGATGFIGSFLLSELILQTSATIHCLVRADNEQHAIDRVSNSLASYDIWDESIHERIKVYCGDLSKQHLGLNQQQWAHLCSRVDIVFHNGATVHHLTPYEQLKPTNVSGTLEILNLCTTEKNKELHFLSTLSVLPPPALAGENQFSENTPLANSPIPEGGYNRSKWMAEHLVWQARERGLKASIYRPGPISGDSLNGHCNANDFLYRLMLGYLYSKQAPDGETMLDLLPVDYAAKAIIYLALHNDEQTGSCYHLIHPNPVSSNLLFESCLNNGIEMQRVSYQQWFMSLQKIASSDSEHPLFPLVALFASRKQTDQKALTPTETHLPYDTSFSQGLLKDAPFDLPDLNEALFSTYLKSLNEVKVSSTNMNRHTSDNSSSSQSVMTL